MKNLFTVLAFDPHADKRRTAYAFRRAVERQVAVAGPRTGIYVRFVDGRPSALVLALRNAVPEPHDPRVAYVKAAEWLENERHGILDSSGAAA